MKVFFLVFLFVLITGCARVNRWRGDFYGVARTSQFEDYQGKREIGAVLFVSRSENLHVIGHDNKYLPTTGFSAVLLTRGSRLARPELFPTNVELIVRGTLDIASPRSKSGKTTLHEAGSVAGTFHPSLRVGTMHAINAPASSQSNSLPVR